MNNPPVSQDKIQNKDIVDVLLEQGMLMRVQAEEIRQKAKARGRSIDEFIDVSGILSEESLARAYGILYNLPFIQLSNIQIPYRILTRIPEKIAKEHLIVAFSEEGSVLKIAIAKPYRLQKERPGVLAKLKKEKQFDYELYVTTLSDFDKAADGYSQEPKQQNISVKDEAIPAAKPARNILDVLLAQNLINQQEYQEIKDAADYQGYSYEEYLSKIGKVLPDDLARAQATLLGLSFVSLKKLPLDYNNLSKFPYNISASYRLIVFGSVGDKVFKVATDQPQRVELKDLIDFIEKRNHIEVEIYVTTADDLNYGLTQYSSKQKEAQKKIKEQELLDKAKSKGIQGPKPPSPSIFQAPLATPIQTAKEEPDEKIGEIDLGKLIKKDIGSIEELKKVIETEMVPRIVAALINFALVKKASDIHLEPTDTDLKVRYRIDGILRDIVRVKKDLHPAIISRIKISAHLRIDEQRVPQDGRFDVSFHEGEVDIRVSTLPTVRGEKVVLRLLDKSEGILTLEQLGVRGQSFRTLVENVKKPYGMILATGPTGSGKTTTLYAIIQYINSSEINIVTLEDPIEYEIEGVNHTQVRPDIGYSFADGLRSILRQDPNVIMVGEIRDKETAGMAIHAALTGHLVLSTLHTNDASGAVPRLIDMGIEPFLITSSTNLVIAQRLVRKICPQCREKITLPPAFMKQIENELAKMSHKAKVNAKRPLQFYRGRGCSACNQGYSGRIGVFEMLPITKRIQDLAVQRVSGLDIKKAAIEDGMITMKQDGILKALDGITSIDEVLRVTLSAVVE